MPRGGRRPGAGRPRGARNRFSAEDRQRIGRAAVAAAEEAIGILLEVAREGRSELARVSAARELVAITFGREPELVRLAHVHEPTPFDRAFGEVADALAMATLGSVARKVFREPAGSDREASSAVPRPVERPLEAT